jgi:hypothetical protein
MVPFSRVRHELTDLQDVRGRAIRVAFAFKYLCVLTVMAALDEPKQSVPLPPMAHDDHWVQIWPAAQPSVAWPPPLTITRAEPWRLYGEGVSVPEPPPQG